MNVEIAQRLADLRREHGFSQEELAEKLGLSRQAVSKWERAESSPDTDNLIALARLYGTSLDELLRIEPRIQDDVEFERTDKAAAGRRQQATPPGAGAPVQDVGRKDPSFSAGPPWAGPYSYGDYRDDEDDFYYDKFGTRRRKTTRLWYFPYPVFVVAVFCALGFLFNLWHPGWVVFLSIPAYYWICNIMDGSERGKRGVRVLLLCLFTLLVMVGAAVLFTQDLPLPLIDLSGDPN
jgi:transcriptional regulator with XRE-family HTH domain